MIARLKRWMFGDPVTFTDDRMLRIRMTAKTHSTPPKAPLFEIKNPRFFMARRKQRVRA